MSHGQIEAWLDSLNALGSRLGLDTMRALMERLGNPQDRIKTAHIAGTNGKGTTVMVLARVLKKEYQTIGTYTSPAIGHWSESICIDGAPIAADSALALLTEILAVCCDMTAQGLLHPTRFEVETALAFLYFYRNGCQMSLIETGLGGLLDATNVIKSPEFVVLTPISLDHTAVLGETLAEIAAAKCGIIKPDTIVYTHPQQREVLDVIEQACNRVRAKVVLPISQFKGFTAAYEALQMFGRFTTLTQKPRFIVDGAHNPAAVIWLLKKLNPQKKCVFIVGIFRDKDYNTMLKLIAPHAKKIIVFDMPHNTRLLDSGTMKAAAELYHDTVKVAHSPADAVKQAFEGCLDDDTIVSLGSLSTISAVTNAVREREKNG